MLSQTAEYALRAVVCLVNCPENSLTTTEIAQITNVPSSYLSKILQALGRANIVKSQRGLHGGFKLTKPAERISLLEVINAVDPIQTIIECPLGLKDHGKKLCPLHKKLNDTILVTQEAFRGTTARGFLTSSDNPASLCEIFNPQKK